MIRRQVKAKSEKYRLMMEKILERPLGEIFEVTEEEFQKIKRYVYELAVVLTPEIKRRGHGA